MGIFDDTASVISRKSSHHHHSSSRSKDKDKHKRSSLYSISSHKSRSRSRSPGGKSIAASIFGLGEDEERSRHRSSRHGTSSRAGGFFGLPNVSTRSFFGGDKHRSSTSSYRRSPRPSFFTRAYKQLKRLLRDLVYYAKRHPVKVFTLVVLPLITGGALTALLARFGLRLPNGLERMLGMGARAMSGDSIGLVGEAVRMASGMGGREGSVRVERNSWERDIGGGFGGGGGSWGGGMMKSVREFFD
ncbi:hypothetical protein M406DRAFT_347603 [Cryphonectria parasitica EP155]|uniref:Uncharacterized protein n=1 Tax=Cryphonectria parasitica (strain ATCC 38755 / EP155) TaxID=660469 RepID=A0A9P4XXE5_CRYP1|nr:uncharacterized protein M406DRAFT_347603 [Cryphonectria parasitica EP155]KAF3762626.1 hypothetical protein M406DRAFT_347603 [Cryphonectria parasitica EP155]